MQTGQSNAKNKQQGLHTLMLVKKICILFFCKTLLVFMKFIWKGKENTVFPNTIFFVTFSCTFPTFPPFPDPPFTSLGILRGDRLGKASVETLLKQSGSKTSREANSSLPEKVHAQWKEPGIIDVEPKGLPNDFTFFSSVMRRLFYSV